MSATELDKASLVAHLVRYLADIPQGERRIVAAAGAPASGKIEPDSTAIVPMDGFHFDARCWCLVAWWRLAWRLWRPERVNGGLPPA